MNSGLSLTGVNVTDGTGIGSVGKGVFVAVTTALVEVGVGTIVGAAIDILDRRRKSPIKRTIKKMMTNKP